MAKNYTVGKFQLDDYQMKLLNHDDNTIVIAGAGAGKTLTIVGKINYLIENKKINPENILVISFTNASVNDLKEKIDYPINIYTFHKLAMEILDKINFNYQICNTNTLDYIIEESLKNADILEQKSILKYLKIGISYKKFINSKEFKSFSRFIATFINLWKTNNFNFQDIPLQKYSKLEKKILLLIFKIYQKYTAEKKSINSLDFDDLIYYATYNISKAKLTYQYIIIDEFQDTSFIRINLIKEIFKHTDSKVIVVGDDWQSIYRFSGCNLNIFLNFPQFFPNVRTIKLVNTYRNSQELINIASKFVMKNPLQIQKSLVSIKHVDNPIIFIPYQEKIGTFKKVVQKMLEKSDNIMVLSRNNNDIYNYLDKDITLTNSIINFYGHEIKYYTVHKSKGLEAEYVLLLNCDNSTLGFPNQIENNKLIDVLFTDKEIAYAEERRLFYVAITRCKEKTYIMYDKDNPSLFIKELKKIVKKEFKKINYFRF